MMGVIPRELDRYSRSSIRIDFALVRPLYRRRSVDESRLDRVVDT